MPQPSDAATSGELRQQVDPSDLLPGVSFVTRQGVIFMWQFPTVGEVLVWNRQASRASCSINDLKSGARS